MKLPKREQELLDIIYQLGEGSAEEIRSSMQTPPKNATVRVILKNLVEKKLIQFRKEGKRFIYSPKVARHKAGESALRRLIKTFFHNSPTQAVATMISSMEKELSEEDILELETLIADMKQRSIQ